VINRIRRRRSDGWKSMKVMGGDVIIDIRGIKRNNGVMA